MHPPTWTRSEALGLKHPWSSPSVFVSLPPGRTQRCCAFALSQYSKCPISSENATLYECAAHGTRVCTPDVEYIGWNAYGASVHVLASGWNSGCANPFATLAVIDPVWPVVSSWTAVTRPAAE